jgi:hypothetical protein
VDARSSISVACHKNCGRQIISSYKSVIKIVKKESDMWDGGLRKLVDNMLSDFKITYIYMNSYIHFNLSKI